MKKHILLILTLTAALTGCSSDYANKNALKRALCAVTDSTVSINSVIPFEWDAMYSFEPYTSKSQIEQISGIKSNLIQESVSEGMTNLLFINDGEAVASVCAYPSSLGYYFDFFGSIEYSDHAEFAVERHDDIIVLTKK